MPASELVQLPKSESPAPGTTSGIPLLNSPFNRTSKKSDSGFT